ncbi:hypothetical protein BOSEA31B_20071 [Hyphomicrobiales bacterium]|nr:hypothetical protein BOSEA31B_20071 [Hyphomicrobiales bacterium]
MSTDIVVESKRHHRVLDDPPPTLRQFDCDSRRFLMRLGLRSHLLADLIHDRLYDSQCRRAIVEIGLSCSHGLPQAIRRKTNKFDLHAISFSHTVRRKRPIMSMHVRL